MRIIIFIITVLVSVNVFGQPQLRTTGMPDMKPTVDSTQFIKLLSLKDLQIITQSLKDKMTVTEWEKVTQAIDKVYLARREEYLKSKDTASKKDKENPGSGVYYFKVPVANSGPNQIVTPPSAVR